jgi:hypothetical protein
MNPAELDTGPPEMRRPSWKLGRHEESMERTTVDIYPNNTPASSDISDMVSKWGADMLSGEVRRD